jgi:hypothetical protein
MRFIIKWLSHPGFEEIVTREKDWFIKCDLTDHPPLAVSWHEAASNASPASQCTLLCMHL